LIAYQKRLGNPVQRNAELKRDVRRSSYRECQFAVPYDSVLDIMKCQSGRNLDVGFVYFDFFRFAQRKDPFCYWQVAERY
jgi:hypothetical protein